MYMVCHGGHVCGIKHIYDIGRKPSAVRCGKTALPDTDPYYSHIGAGEIVPGRDAFYETCPTEPAWRRLDRYLKYIDEKRPQGIVEIIVVSRGEHMTDDNEYYDGQFDGYDQYDNWKPTLLKRGFVEVNKCKNVNSGGYMHVFHRNSGEVPVIEENKGVHEPEPNSPAVILSPFD